MQLEDDVAQPRDRELHGLLGFGEHRELLGVADRAPQHLQAHAHGGHDLDRIVVDALGDALALELAGCGELVDELPPLRSADPGRQSGGSDGGGWGEGSILHTRETPVRAIAHSRISL